MIKRLEFIDLLRGLAIVLMVINHAGHYLTARPINDWAYLLVYLTVTMAAPLFLFLVGFSLALSHQKNPVQDFSRYLKRGLILILFGYLINLFFYLDEPLYRGRVLFAIGLSIVLAYPFLKLSAKKHFSLWLASLAVIGLASFTLFYPALQIFSNFHPVWAEIFLIEYPIYPWFFLVLLGLAAGHDYVTAKEGSQAGLVRGWLMTGMFLLLAWLILTIGYQPLSPFSFNNDLILNNCWNPSLITWFLVLGMIYLFLAISHLIVKKKYILTSALELIGRHALTMYFLQFFVIKTIGNGLLGIGLGSELVFSFAVVVISLILVVVALEIDKNRNIKRN